MATDGALFFLRGAARMLQNITDEQEQELESPTDVPSSSIQKNEDSFLMFAPVIVGLVILAFFFCMYRMWLSRVFPGRETSTISDRAIIVHEKRIFDLNSKQRQAVLEAIFSEASKAVAENNDEQVPYDVETTDGSEGTQDSSYSIEVQAEEDRKIEGPNSQTEGMSSPPDETEENVCSICLSGYKEGDVSIASKSCTHIFHKDCILEWLDKHADCPVCRVDMVTEGEINKAATSLIGKTRMCRAVASLSSVPSSLLRTPPPTSPGPRGPHTTPTNTIRRSMRVYGDTWNHTR